MDLLPEEEVEVEKAVKEIETYRIKTISERSSKPPLVL